METIRATEARANFAALLRRVSAGGERLVIERRGEPRALLVPIDDRDQGSVPGDLAARRENEALLSQAAKVANLGHWIWDEMQDRGVYCSETLARMNGVTVEAYLARYATLEDLLEEIHPEDRARYEQTIAKAKLNKRAYDIEFRDILPGGGLRYLREYGEPHFDETGRHVRTIGTLQDITEQRLAELALREGEQRFKDFADATSDWFWEMDENCRFSYFSDRFTEITGVQQEALLGKTREETGIPNVDPEAWQDHLSDLAARRSFRDFRHPRTYPDGREVLLSVNGKAVFDDSGKFKGYRGTGTDITERKHAEDALRESEALLAQAAQMANLGHWVWDEIEDRCVYCSEPLAQISGVSVEEYLQRYATVEDLLVEVHPEDRARYERVLAEAKREQRAYDVKFRDVTPNGEVLYLRERGEPVFDPAGRHVRTVGTMQDITEHRQIEEKLRQARDELELRVEQRTRALQEANEALKKVVAERKRAESGLRQSEERYRNLFASAPIAIREEDFSKVKAHIDILDIDNREDFVAYVDQHPGFVEECSKLIRMVDANQAALNLHGTDDNTKFLSEFTSNFGAEALETLKRALVAIHNRETQLEFETSLNRADGSDRNVMARWTVATGHENTYSRVLFISIDITELKLAEEALKLREAQLKQAQRMAKIGHTIWDEIEGRMAYHSVTVDLIWGTPPEETFATFAEYLDTVHPDDRERVSLVMEQAYKDHTSYEIDYRIVRPDGEAHFIHEIAEPEIDTTGRLVRTVSTVQDVTEQKRVEEKLRESERRYRELFDESPVAIWEEDWSALKQMFDDLARQGVKDWRNYFNSHRDQLKTAYDLAKTIEVSRATIDLYHDESKEEIIRRSSATFVIDEEMDAFRETVLSFLAGQMTVDIEAKDMAGDGSEIIVRRRVVIPPKHRDDWSRVIYAIEDITERKRVEEQLRQAQKMEAVGQLTGGVAHDFNNLLAVIMGNAELLAARLGDDDRAAQAVIRAASRGARLTERLLAFSRRQPLRPQAFDLDAAVSGMTDMLQRTLGETIEMTISATSGLWTAEADPGQVENALLNLAINARDAMPGGGKLLIETANVHLDESYVDTHPEATAGDYVMLAVTDSGTGMTPEILEHAFEPFFTTKQVGEGSGLGLSMIYGFVKQSDGQLAIYSEPGHGTTVKLYLPRTEAAAERTRPETTAAVHQGQGETVLVVEDDPDVRQLAVTLLKELGYKVLEAPDGTAALAILERSPRPDLLLSDVVLSGALNGPELAREAGQLFPGIKVLFISGYAESAAHHNGLTGGHSELLNKPFHRRDLARKVRSVLDR